MSASLERGKKKQKLKNSKKEKQKYKEEEFSVNCDMVAIVCLICNITSLNLIQSLGRYVPCDSSIRFT